MRRITASLIDTCALEVFYAQAGFNGNPNVKGNQGRANGAGNSNIGQNAGQCIGESNGAARPGEKEQNDRLKSFCDSPLIKKKHAEICQ
ncbi:hypothetical protein [Serratia ureilytica]|uniref:hypothetical protein n=1 Tax=Serratia ureilytica TaxID=300181 RepID=UPI001D192F04|nr:hypothetical protein [Serratia ureilytica]MCC4106638.1 hypothetical protein [Serratia ureilytica]